MDSAKGTDKLAVLIDADNAQPAIIEGLLAEVAQYGTANVKRIYGNWTDDKLKGWKATLLEHSIQPMQQFAYTSGKNATDSAMIIDAMDLLYTDSFDGFCIVSSDSDFTRLASRLREDGLVVYGFGEKKTPKPFVAACDKFIFTEVLRPKDQEADRPKGKSATRATWPTCFATRSRPIRTTTAGRNWARSEATSPSRHRSSIRATTDTGNSRTS
jgi:hypothetical protein